VQRWRPHPEDQKKGKVETMPTCNQQINLDNQRIALAANPVVDCHVIPVLVTGRTSNTITFVATGAGGVTVTCTENWGDPAVMWAACPSTLPSNATPSNPGAPPAIGATGNLYLSVDCLARNGIPLTVTQEREGPKWPKNLGLAPFEQLSIWPTRVVVTGIELSTGEWHEGTFDVLDVDSAARGPTLVLGEPLELLLSQNVFTAFKVSFVPPPPEQAWPWTKLAAAVANILSAERDPAKLANAWRVVSTCVERIEVAKLLGFATEQHLADLRTILPEHPAVVEHAAVTDAEPRPEHFANLTGCS
jgi:hypothetical protein